MPQGLPEKIQVQLLLADLPLQLGDLPPRLRQVIGLRRYAARPLHLQRLGLGRPPGLGSKRLRASLPEGVTPAIDDRSLDRQLKRQRRAALAGPQPLDHLQLELAAETS